MAPRSTGTGRRRDDFAADLQRALGAVGAAVLPPSIAVDLPPIIASVLEIHDP